MCTVSAAMMEHCRIVTFSRTHKDKVMDHQVLLPAFLEWIVSNFHVQVHASLFNSFCARICRFSKCHCFETSKNGWLIGSVRLSMEGEYSGRLSGSRHRAGRLHNPPNVATILWCGLFQSIPCPRYGVGCHIALVVIQKTKNFLFAKWNNAKFSNTLDVFIVFKFRNTLDV